METICVVGLGYVGLPLAVAFSKHYIVIGFDINKERIASLQIKEDLTKAVSSEELLNADIFFTTRSEEIKKAKYVIIAVPTPVDDSKRPDLSALKKASAIVGKNIQRGTIIIFESTVYPGVTENICLPIIENESKMRLGDFGLGYSPERINPGDKIHQLYNTIKIVAGHNEETKQKVVALYKNIVSMDLHEAPSIKVAEAAKIVENVQRDMNIALVNEFSLIFNKLNIDTKEVLDAACTKWNFHKYYPGLVGGHCIGVDPYYLAFQAIEHGYYPKIILCGREINDYMARHVAEMVIKELNNAGKILKESAVALLGLTFKEDVTDFRNSRAKNVIERLHEYGISVVAVEPNVSEEVIKQEFNVENKNFEDISVCDAVIIINKHKQFDSITLAMIKQKLRTPILIDTKRRFDKKQAVSAGLIYRTL